MVARAVAVPPGAADRGGYGVRDGTDEAYEYVGPAGWAGALADACRGAGSRRGAPGRFARRRLSGFMTVGVGGAARGEIGGVGMRAARREPDAAARGALWDAPPAVTGLAVWIAAAIPVEISHGTPPFGTDGCQRPYITLPASSLQVQDLVGGLVGTRR